MTVAHTLSRRENPDSRTQSRAPAHILFVHQRLGAFGGAEANIRITAEELGRRGHTLSLLYDEGSGKNEEGYRQLFSQCHRISQNPREIRTLIAQRSADLIYLHSLSRLDLMGALFVSGIPIVRMVHDHSLYCLRNYKYNPLTRRPCSRPASGYCIFPCAAPLARNRGGLLPLKWASFAKLRQEIDLNKQCEALIVYSQHQKAELVANGFDPSRIHLHVPMECRGNEHPLSNLSSRNLILFAGQIIRGKGVDLLLQALKNVQVPFECIIAGDGSHRAFCERLCRRLGLEAKVRFTGYLSPAELERLYLEASLFAFSSIWPEPFGMAGPEAMRFGLPVVGFDTGGVREWLIDGENGFVAQWGNVHEFAQRMNDLLSNKELARRLGLNGRARVNREYAAAGQIDLLEKLFAQAIDQHKLASRSMRLPATPMASHSNNSTLLEAAQPPEPALNT